MRRSFKVKNNSRFAGKVRAVSRRIKRSRSMYGSVCKKTGESAENRVSER